MPTLLINFLNKRKSILPRSRLIWPSHIGSILQKKKKKWQMCQPINVSMVF